MAYLRLTLFLLVVIGLFGSGVWVAGKLRKIREPNILRYRSSLFGFVPLCLAAAVAFCTFRVIELPGWEGNGPWVLAAFMLFNAIMITLIVLGTKITVTTDELIVSQLLPPMVRRIALDSVQDYNLEPHFRRLRIKYQVKSKTKVHVFILYFLEGDDIIPRLLSNSRIR